MKKLTYVLALLTACAGLMGCPYESQVPISDPQISVDKRVLGKWGSLDEVYIRYQVSQKSPNEYLVLQESSVGDITRYTGFISEIRGTSFLNLHCDSTGIYYLYRLQSDPAAKKLTLIPLSNDISQHFSTVEGLRSYVEKNMTFTTLYDSENKSEFVQIEAEGSGYN